MHRFKLPEHVCQAIEKLECNGHEAFLVGGAVRSLLMGIEPEDWDLSTSARPDQVRRLFRTCPSDGLIHGTVVAQVGGCPLEITTYRTESDYMDFRRPGRVTFVSSLYDDLLRRDFTMNAIAYNPRMGIVDLHHGCDDIRNGVIRCLGDPEQRFCEDALRMMRAVRFCATLNFTMEPSAYDAVSAHCALLRHLSGERIFSELTRLLLSNRRLELLFDCGIGAVILPEVARCFSVWQNNSIQIYDVGNHLLETLYNTPKNPALRYAALLHDAAKPDTLARDQRGVDSFPGHPAASAAIAREVLKRFGTSARFRSRVCSLIKAHHMRIRLDGPGIKRAAASLDSADFFDLLSLMRANAMAHNEKYAPKALADLERAEAIYFEVLSKKEPMYLRDLAVDGNHMKELGLSGTEIGRMLGRLLKRVINEPGLNQKSILIEQAKRYLAEKG